MKTLPSKLFPNCAFSSDDDAGFYDIAPAGFGHVVTLYLGRETVKNDQALARAAAFFDRIAEWDAACRQEFISTSNNIEDTKMITEYFDFHKTEIPEVFDTDDISALSLVDMINCLKLAHMGAHGSGDNQQFNVDFMLPGSDEILCAYFNSTSMLDHLAWES